MSLLKQSTTRNVMVLMIDSSDHITGKTGLTLTVTASKDGAAFATVTPTVTERGSGWYSLALTTSHTDTLGDFAVHVTATGADPTDLQFQVVLELPGVVSTNNDKTGYAVGTGGIAATSFASGALTAAAIAADAIGASELAQDAAQEIADEFLNRDLAGGSSGNTRNVRNSLRALRNKVAVSGGTATIYQEDDTAAAWTAAVTTTAGNPITTVDPA